MTDKASAPAPQSDDELIRWAKKRGWVTFGIFCLLGALATLGFLLLR